MRRKLAGFLVKRKRCRREKVPVNPEIQQKIDLIRKTKSIEDLQNIFQYLTKNPQVTRKYAAEIAKAIESNKLAVNLFLTSNTALFFMRALGSKNEIFFRTLSEKTFLRFIKGYIPERTQIWDLYSSHLSRVPAPWEKRALIYMVKGLNRGKVEGLAKLFVKCYVQKSPELEFYKEFFKYLAKTRLLDNFILALGENVGYFRTILRKHERAAKLLAKELFVVGAPERAILKLTGFRIADIDLKLRLKVAKNLLLNNASEKKIKARTGFSLEKVLKILWDEKLSSVVRTLEDYMCGVKKLFSGWEPKIFKRKRGAYIVFPGIDRFESFVGFGIYRVRGNSIKNFIEDPYAPMFVGGMPGEKYYPIGRVKFRIVGNPAGKPRLLIEAIQGIKGKAKELREFSEIVGKPWSVYLVEKLIEQAKKNGFYGVGFITFSSQPYASHAPKTMAALYNSTAKYLNFTKEKKMVLYGDREYYFKRL